MSESLLMRELGLEGFRISHRHEHKVDGKIDTVVLILSREGKYGAKNEAIVLDEHREAPCD